ERERERERERESWKRIGFLFRVGVNNVCFNFCKSLFLLFSECYKKVLFFLSPLFVV
ncbi:unnamed protein product, partial [Prunus brigantina]